MSLRTQLRQGILLCLILPVSIIFIGINTALYRHWTQVYAEEVQDLNAEVALVLDRTLAAEMIRMKALAVLPNVEHLLEVAERTNKSLSIAGRRERMVDVQDQWMELGRDEVMVRNVLNNSVGELFNHVVRREPTLDWLWLTDAAGALLAASDKTERYDYGQTEEWTLARSQKGGRVVSVGMEADGRVRLALSIWEDGTTPIFRGVLQAVVDLSVVDLTVEGLTPDASFASAIIDGTAWPVAGNAAMIEEGEGWSTWMEEAGSEKKWCKGYRYDARALLPELVWARPAWVVTLSRDSAFPLAVFGPLFISIALSITALFGLLYMALAIGRMVFFKPYNDLLEAGQWILRHALNYRTGVAVSKEAVLPVVRDPLVTDELEAWLSRLQAEARSAGSALTREMETDLALAKDFQLAYLNRPYPKIPNVHAEGRLRLAFCHCYKPTMALGGDFFDIIPLAPDSAGVLVADVMGHGARSALITAILRTLLRDLSAQGRNARHFITEVNRQFCDVLKAFPQPIFASAFYFVPDTTARVATFSTAGHPAPFHIRRSVGRVSRLEVPSPHGTALGLIPTERYTGGHVRLLDGDVYIFFTDGMYEASNKEGQEFGLVRMEKVIRLYMYKSAQTIIDELIRAVEKFAGDEPLNDDICMVAVEITTELEPEQG